MVHRLQGLVLPGRLHDELAVSQQPAGGRPLEAHIRDLAERHHIHCFGDDAGGEKQPLRSYYEVFIEPFVDFVHQPQDKEEPHPPDHQHHGAVAVRDRGREQAGEGESAQDLRHRPDQHRRVEPNGDDLALVRE